VEMLWGNCPGEFTVELELSGGFPTGEILPRAIIRETLHGDFCGRTFSLAGEGDISPNVKNILHTGGIIPRLEQSSEIQQKTSFSSNVKHTKEYFSDGIANNKFSRGGIHSKNRTIRG